MFKRMAGAAALLILLTFPVSASMVSLVLVETGLDNGMPSTQYSGIWEGGLMEAFFNAGHIVTNSPVARIESRPLEDLSGIVEDDFYDAVYGGADYFLLAYLEHQNRDGKAVPSVITLKLYSSDSRALLFSGDFPVGRRESFNEEFKFAQNAGQMMLSYIR